MAHALNQMKAWIDELSLAMGQGIEPIWDRRINFLRDKGLGLTLIDLIDTHDEQVDVADTYLAALIFALDICLAQYNSEKEAGSKQAALILDQFMDHIAELLLNGKHTLSYWMPILNSFYDVHVELTDNLRDAYIELASFEEESHEVIDQLAEIRQLIIEMSDFSDYDIAENFFAQSHAMPPAFFAELMVDLFRLEEGQDIAPLFLLHPNAEVRSVIVATMDELVTHIQLSSLSLSRLNLMKNWYPVESKRIERWIRIQRKKEVVFLGKWNPAPIARIRASEVDGAGVQGIFIEFHVGRQYRLCGLLFKYDIGIVDVWFTDPMSKRKLADNYREASVEGVILREVDFSYFLTLGQHFLSVNVDKQVVPNLYFLELQELINVQMVPEPLVISDLMQQLGVQIMPFNEDAMLTSLKRSKTWLRTKAFTQTWYLENPEVDKLVNQSSSFVDGVRVCDIKKAMERVLHEELEQDRSFWTFYFLWISLWFKSVIKRSEKLWEDSFFIAHALWTGVPMRQIPVMHEMARQTVLNSAETMQDRRTHLSSE